jgi:hypothetical protein
LCQASMRHTPTYKVSKAIKYAACRTSHAPV